MEDQLYWFSREPLRCRLALRRWHSDGFIPMELIAIGLAGCTAMDVISILIKKQQAITDFDWCMTGLKSHESIHRAVIRILLQATTSLKPLLYGQSNCQRRILPCPGHVWTDNANGTKLSYL
jgi:hypothetical protein